MGEVFWDYAGPLLCPKCGWIGEDSATLWCAWSDEAEACVEVDGEHPHARLGCPVCQWDSLAPALDLGIPNDPGATVITCCLFCPAAVETRTGLQGVAEMEAAGWEAVAGGDWGCPKCSQSRADLIGEEW